MHNSSLTRPGRSRRLYLKALLAGIALTGVAGCAGGGRQQQTQAPSGQSDLGAASQAPGPKGDTIKTGSVTFLTDLDAATDQARKSHKLLMVDLYTDWCGWCRKLDEDTYSQAEVGQVINKGFVPVKLNPEKDARGARLQAQFQVDGYPAVLFLTPEGKLVHSLRQYAPPQAFLQTLAEAESRKATTG